MWVNNLEFAGQNTSRVDVIREGLNRLIVSQNLGSGGCWHRGNQKRVSYTVSGNFLSEAIPVPKISGSNTPQVKLEFSLSHRRIWVLLASDGVSVCSEAGIWSILFGKLA